MSTSQHEAAIVAAIETAEALRRLTDHLGGPSNPRGLITSAYRQAIEALRGKTQRRAAVRGVLADLRRMLGLVMRDTLEAASGIGLAAALAQLEAAQLTATGANEIATDDQRAAWLAEYDSQASKIIALSGPAADESIILGDASRAGLLSAGIIIAAGDRWLSEVVLAGYAPLIARSAGRGRGVYLKQAIAAVDHRTTDCCLRVNGQTQPIDKPYHLTGTPRYADYQDSPPFHRYCRTASALVPSESASDAITQSMQTRARAELGRRTRGERTGNE